MMKAVLGESMPLEWLLQYPDDPRAKAFVRKLLMTIYRGDLSLIQRPNPYPMSLKSAR
ncbi:MAG: hypothetical protein HYV99_02415 [Betaproteobacteria bacterium]|nr:hypothetical protein [Betaproteobacteria bacterium]